MKKPLSLLLAITAALAIPAFAATRTATLDVPGMTCAACPITVKHALAKVEGVVKTDVSLEKQQALVTFDDQKTNVQALIKATAEAGYPSTLKQ